MTAASVNQIIQRAHLKNGLSVHLRPESSMSQGVGMTFAQHPLQPHSGGSPAEYKDNSAAEQQVSRNQNELTLSAQHRLGANHRASSAPTMRPVGSG